MAAVFLIGALFGIAIAATLAGWIWLFLTPGDDHPLTDKEIRERVGETWK